MIEAGGGLAFSVPSVMNAPATSLPGGCASAHHVAIAFVTLAC